MQIKQYLIKRDYSLIGTCASLLQSICLNMYLHGLWFVRMQVATMCKCQYRKYTSGWGAFDMVERRFNLGIKFKRTMSMFYLVYFNIAVA